MRWLSRVVTFAILAAVVAGGALLFRAKIPTQKLGQDFVTWANFRDGSRLAVGSPVVIAGIRVGDITGLSITGGFARVDLRLQDNIELPADSWATRRADSLFGDSYVELIPSNAEEGASRVRLLHSGEPITHVEEGGSTDAALRAIGHAMPRVDSGLEITHDAAGAARRWVAGPFAHGVDAAARWIASGRIEAPIARMNTAMTSIESFVDRTESAVHQADPDVTHTFDRIDHGITSARNQLATVRSGIHDGLTGVRDGVDRVDPTIAQLQDVVGAIHDGRGDDAKGAFGRLVNDPTLGNQIADTAEDVASAAHSLTRLRSWLGLRIEYDVFSKEPRFYATAELRARNDKFFLFELEKGPLGGLPADQLADVAGSSAFVRSVSISDSLRVTAQFGKQFGRLGVRGGLKDSTFGVGADLWLADNKLELSADVFGGFTDVPRVKLTAAYAVFRSAYLIAGIDDAFTSPGYLPITTAPGQTVPAEFVSLRYGRDYYVGAILHFDDADLTTLLRVYGALLVGLL